MLGRPWHGEHYEAPRRSISPEYFRTLGARLSRGRYFGEDPDASKPQVAIVNQALVRKYFSGEDPIGKQLAYVSIPEKPLEIVGVVEDVKEGPLDEDIRRSCTFRSSRRSRTTLLYRSDWSERRVSVTATRRHDPSDRSVDRVVSRRNDDGEDPRFAVRVSPSFLGVARGRLRPASALLPAWSDFSRRDRLLGEPADARDWNPHGARSYRRFGLSTDSERGGGIDRAWNWCGSGGVAGRDVSDAQLAVWSAIVGRATLAAVAVTLAVAALAGSFLPAHRAAAVNPTEALRGE